MVQFQCMVACTGDPLYAFAVNSFPSILAKNFGLLSVAPVIEFERPSNSASGSLFF